MDCQSGPVIAGQAEQIGLTCAASVESWPWTVALLHEDRALLNQAGLGGLWHARLAARYRPYNELPVGSDFVLCMRAGGRKLARLCLPLLLSWTGPQHSCELSRSCSTDVRVPACIGHLPP